ncbi:single-stranded DNA-binding protein [Candidatus Microgenomates bacterium]|nr:single-stranded DNA-binding protein [Candidatus Microgenomates bacterium]
MASRSINKVILLGNLTRDPELKYTPTGAAVCTFGVATNRTWTTAEGQTKEDVQYHRVTAWNKLAELCGKLLVKGRKIYMEGRITYRNYTDKAGQQRSITEIILDDFILLDSKRTDGEHAAEGHDNAPVAHEATPSIDDTPTEEPASDETIKPSDIPF